MAQPPNVLQGPEPIETAELHFKSFCKLKIFDTETKYGGGHCSMVAVSQYYGLIFVGNLNGFTVIKTKSLTPSVDFENFPKKDIVLDVKPTHISIDFSQKILAVVCSSKPGSLLVFYNIQSFANKDVLPLKVTPISKLFQNATAEVVDLAWQPNTDGSLMMCMSDGSVLAVSQGAKDGPLFTLPATAQAVCLCWSPKGKQIVIGSLAGTLSQYKPDLKVVKTLPPPSLFKGATVMVVSVLWISSYQFAVAYNNREHPESAPIITIVNAGKNEPVNVINFDDITYSSSLFRNHQIYMTHQSAWNLIFVSSANSIEVAVLHSKDNASWEQWLLGDASRAELPLDSDRQETFPLGWAFDFTSQDSISWGEGTLPPMPRLLLLSDEGLLCIFNVVNAAENAPQLCSPPKENLDDSLFVVSTSKPTTPHVSEPPKSIQSNKISFGDPPTFVNSKQTISFGGTTGFAGFVAQKPPQTTTPQQEQLQSQPQNQTQQVLVTSASTSTTTFKLPPSQFGTGVTFSFGGNSSSMQDSKLTSSGNTTANVEQPQSVSLTTASSPSTIHLFAKNEQQLSPAMKQKEITIEVVNSKQILASDKLEGTVEPVGKTEEVSSGPSPCEAPETPELTAVDDSVYLNAIQEEIEHFGSELQQLTAKVGNLDVKVGSEEDKASMKKSMCGLYDFWKELKETTEGQSAEIHTTAMDLMEAFAWLEDARSRNLQRKNPSYIELKKSEELDPLSARHMNEISHLKYYIENQLKQLTGYLEKEWMDHQESYRNEMKNRMAVPPLEEVYKTMHYQLKILHKQKILVEELKEKIVQKKRRNKPQSFITSVVNASPIQNSCNRISELSKLAENLLQLKITKEENSPHAGAWEMMKSQLNAISERSKKLTRDKQTALRDALSECDMVKIRPVKASLESSTFLRSLALEKAAQKVLKPRPEEQKEKTKTSSVKISVADVAKPTPEVKPAQVPEKPRNDPALTVMELPKCANTPPEKPSSIPFTVKVLTNLEEKSPLASLSGIVSSIGKKSEAKTFVFGSQNAQKQESAKESVAFCSGKTEQKKEEPKSTQTFSLGTSKPAEPTLSKKEQIVFGGKPIFSSQSTNLVASTKQDSTKSTPTPNIVPATTATATVSFPSIFNAASTTASTTGLPKVNLLFSGKDQSSGLGTSATAGSLFSLPSSTTQTSVNPVFGTATPIFSSTNKNTTVTFTTSTPFLFGPPKTTSDTTVQSGGFTFTQSIENKPITPNVLVPGKPTSETGEIDVVKVDDAEKKTEKSSEKSKESVKMTPGSTVFVTPPVTTSTSKTATSAFSFSTAVAPIAFGVAATTTTAATTASLFGSSTTSSSGFGQVSSTSPTTNIFGGSITTTPIFEGSTPTKNIFGQAAATPTTSEIIIGGSTPTTNTFSQTATTSPTAFGQKPDSISQTANLFGQLLSDSNRPVFGTASSTPTTTTATANIFSSAKNIFGGGTSTTAAALFATTASSIFSQTTSVFGQATTASNIFGQTQSSTSSSFFGQNICSPFGGGSSVTSNQSTFDSGAYSKPIFGQTSFGQTTSNSSIFGGSSGSIFRTSSTTSSNVFQTPTTSTTFGSVTPGPFSGGASSFGETSFGSTSSTFQKPAGGFGSPPVFGGAPALGGSTTFGGSPSFASLSTFGSLSQGTFGQTTGSTTFENLANQNTVGFGNLAQQSQSQGFGGGFGGGATFENKPTFGRDAASVVNETPIAPVISS